MFRTHKIRLNPTLEQESYLKQACGISRFVFNWGLARWKEAKEQGVSSLGPMALKKEFNSIRREQFPWTMEVTKNAVEDGFRRLSGAFKNYYDSKNKYRSGKKIYFPRFKSKKKPKQSFTMDGYRVRPQGNWIKLEKLNEPINMAEQLRYDGDVKWATISCMAGRWYVSISVELDELPEVECPQAATGVDLGLKTLATLSDGTEFENQKLLRSELARLRRLSRRFSRRKEGSGRWWIAKQKLARFHQHVANSRLDVTHKMTSKITCTYHLIAVEDLNIDGMSRNRKIALSVADAGMGEILRQLTYKAKRLIKVGRFYASSKICSGCGCVNRELILSDRRWMCRGCGILHERDFNAAVNILQEGIRLASV